MRLPKYIVFEGIHGSGKTTLAHAFCDYLSSQGYTTEYHHFPDEKDILGAAIRSILIDKNMTKERSVIGALYAGYANRFHIIHQHDNDIIFCLDRHSCTTGLVFQDDIPDHVRKELYGIGFHELQKSGTVFYISIDPDIARERVQKRNKDLFSTGKVWEDKARDTFLDRFYELSQKYEKNLVSQAKRWGLRIHTINNNSGIPELIQTISSFF